MVKKKIVRKKIAVIEKSIKGFLADEDGFVSKETILKVGLATAAGLGVIGAMTGGASGHSSHNSRDITTHNDQAIYDSSGACYKITHTNQVTDHCSHSSY